MAQEYEHEEGKRLIAEVRKRFSDKDAELNTFDERDVRRVNIEDLYVWLFLRHKQKDVDKALEMIVECLRWRQSFGINDLTERNIDRRLFEIGFLYPHNSDKNGNPLVLFHTRLYKKDAHNPQEVKKLVAFGLERLARQNPGQKVTMIFDMQDSGLANMDMDIVKFVITCFQTYFPSMLEYLIVLEMPWILSAAWKLVKTWLSTEGISKIKFVNKAEIFQYVNSDELLVSMGGTDTFTYEYPPQLFSGRKQDPLNANMKNLTPASKQDVEFSSISVSMSVDPSGKNPLSEPFELLRRNGEDSHSSVELSLTESLQKKTKADEKVFSAPKDGMRAPRKRDIRGQRRGQLEHIGPLVTICPADDLVFCGSSTSGGEILQILTVTNTVSSTVAFKVKTTSPENYRVRPSSGPLAPGANVEVNIFLQPGHATNVIRDKFLILSTVVPEKDKDRDVTSLWKQIPKSSIMEHRLRCRFENVPAPVPFAENQDTNKSPRKETKVEPLQMLSKQLREMEKKFDDATAKVTRLEKDMKRLLHLVLVFFVFSIAMAITAGVLLTKNPLPS